MGGRSETMHVADLGDEDRGEDRSDAGELLDGVVAGVVAEPFGDRVGQLVDLAVEGVDERDE